jgi:SAM-dependent methyltransferase
MPGLLARQPSPDKLSVTMATETRQAFWESRWASGDLPWDHGEPAPPLLEFLERGPLRGRRALVPGCGSGHEAAAVAAYGLEVTGLDFSASAVAQASKRYPLPQLSFVEGDLLQPREWFREPFDWVFEHTCLCAMPPEVWPRYVRSVARVLRPGGHFFGIFYIRTREPGGPPFQIERTQIDQLFGPRFVLQERYAPCRSFASRAGREEVRLYRRLAEG